MYNSRACRSICRILTPGMLLLLVACGDESSTTIISPTSDEIATQTTSQITAATTLTATDWTAACQTGDIDSASGCYGDAGSEAFAKINRLGGNPLGYAGVTGSATSSVWIRQIGTGTGCDTTNAQLRIVNTSSGANSTIWICGAELTDGSPVSLSAGLGALGGGLSVDPSNNATGILFSTISVGNMGAGGVTPITSGILYFNASSVLPTVYLFCISTDNASTATTFGEVPQARLGTNC